MILLIFLLLCSSCAAGQDTLLAPGPPMKFSPAKQFRVHGSLDVLVIYWDEWVDSCWNDSTKVWGVEPYPAFAHLFTPCEDKFVIGCSWQHRDPNNLSEFMAFLRRRLGR